MKATSHLSLESTAFGERLRNREPEALEAFFDLYFDRIYGYVRGIVADDHTAEDLTQEIFIKLHGALPTLDPDRGLNPWVYTIAMNRIRDHWRSRSHSEALWHLSLDDEHLEPRLGAGRPESILEQREGIECINTAVDELPADMRVVLALRLRKSLSFEAIGRILKLNGPATRKRYSRALQVLRGTVAERYSR